MNVTKKRNILTDNREQSNSTGEGGEMGVVRLGIKSYKIKKPQGYIYYRAQGA